MKISRMIVQILLVIAAVISFILSFLLWTNNSRYQMQPETKIVDGVTSTQNVIKKMDVYSPSQILWNNSGDLKLVYNNKRNVINAVQNDMMKWKFDDLTIDAKGKSNYEKFLNRKNTIQLLYPMQMPVKYYGQILKKDSLTDNNYMFNRVLISFNKKDKNVYLGNDDSKVIYKVKVNTGSSKNIIKLLKETDISIPVDLHLLNKSVAIEYKEHVSLQPYSYLVNKQEDNSFISNLLGPNNITTRQSGNLKTYSASAYQRLVSDSKRNELSFYDYTKTKEPKTKVQVLNQGFDLVNQINSPLSNAKLSDVNWKNKVLTYREYVEGFPTFQKSDFGATKISFSKSGQVTQFSNKIMQVPVPSDQEPVVLKSTKEIINDLKSMNFNINKISYIDLGYKWQEDMDNKNIVDLIPTYFLRVEGKWYTLDDLIGISDQVGGEY